MDFKKILKIISAVVALAGIAAAVYVAIQKLTAPKEPEYFDDNDFFECDNEIEIVEANAETVEAEPAKEEAKAETEQKKPAPKKKAAKKPAQNSQKAE